MSRCSTLALLAFSVSCNRDAGPASGPPRTHGTDEISPQGEPVPLPRPLAEAMRALGQGQIDEAQNTISAYLEEHPQSARGTFMLGMSLESRGNYSAARSHYEHALILDPDLFVVRDHLGYCLFLLGDLAGARRELSLYLDADPNEPRGHYRLGLVELEEGRLEEAAACFERAIALFEAMRREDRRLLQARRGELAECHARLGDMHFARDDYESARAALLLATSIAPENISAFYTLQLVHRRLGEDDLADQALERYETAKQALIERERTAGE